MQSVNAANQNVWERERRICSTMSGSIAHTGNDRGISHGSADTNGQEQACLRVHTLPFSSNSIIFAEPHYHTHYWSFILLP